MPADMGFVADKLLMENIVFQVVWFSPMSIIPLVFHALIFHSSTNDTVAFY